MVAVHYPTCLNCSTPAPLISVSPPEVVYLATIPLQALIPPEFPAQEVVSVGMV